MQRRVLIADDNRTNLLILQQMLEDGGYEVDAEMEGERALERITGGGYKAAVIDLHMPGFDGVNLLRRYRLLQPSLRIPIIMLTADATFDAQSNSAEAGADAFLTKPVSAEILLSTLDQLIREREVRSLPIAIDSARRLQDESPVLDMSILAELDRVCRDPARLAAVVSTFESEGEALLIRLAEAQRERDYPAFAEWVHAMKGNAANIGARKLVVTCHRIEGAGSSEFERAGMDLVRELRDQFTQVCLALRDLALPVGETPSSNSSRPGSPSGGR
jgi:two-component system sensor histidine kinase RpfC